MGNNEQRQMKILKAGIAVASCDEWRNNAHAELANIFRNLILNMCGLGVNIKQPRDYSLNVLWTIFYQLFCNV